MAPPQATRWVAATSGHMEIGAGLLVCDRRDAYRTRPPVVPLGKGDDPHARPRARGRVPPPPGNDWAVKFSAGSGVRPYRTRLGWERDTHRQGRLCHGFLGGTLIWHYRRPGP